MSTLNNQVMDSLLPSAVRAAENEEKRDNIDGGAPRNEGANNAVDNNNSHCPSSSSSTDHKSTSIMTDSPPPFLLNDPTPLHFC